MPFIAQIGRTALAQHSEPRWIPAVTCGVHALHDGFTDLIYVLLPIWQTEFVLSYAALGLLRMLFAGTMAGLQVPMSLLAKRIGGPLLLALGTATAGGAYLVIGLTGAGFTLLFVALLVGGMGAATQHPIGSSLVSAAYAGSAPTISPVMSGRWRCLPPPPGCSASCRGVQPWAALSRWGW
jgi:MFS transporter, FSR family, fosmidomycin resistance protein